MKRLYLITLVIVLVFSLCACGDNNKETDYVALAQTLVDEAQNICGKMYTNAGLPAQITEENQSDSDKYMAVDSEVLTSIEKMKAATLLYFTEDVAEKELFPVAFEGEEPMYIEQDGVLMVNTEKMLEAWRTQWLFDSAVITEQTDDRVTLRMKVIVSDVEAGMKSLTIVKDTDGNWRLACSIA